MTVNTSRLGIFELIGYLFSGIYVVAVALVLPLFATGVRPASAEMIVDLSASVGAVLIAVCYAVGIITSKLSMAFYSKQGRGEKIFPVPKWYPFESGDNPVVAPWRHPDGWPGKVWKWVDTRVQNVFRVDGRSPFACDEFSKEEKEVCETTYNHLAYVSPLVGSIDRIASVVRFTSSVIVASVASTALTWILIVLILFTDYFAYQLVGLFLTFTQSTAGAAPPIAVHLTWIQLGINWLQQVDLSTQDLTFSVFLSVANVFVGFGSWRVSMEYANSYWSAVAIGILSIQIGRAHV